MGSRFWPVLTFFFHRAEDNSRPEMILSFRLSHRAITFQVPANTSGVSEACQFAQKKKKKRPLVKIINVVSVKKEEETQPCVEMCDHFKLGTSLETAVTL